MLSSAGRQGFGLEHSKSVKSLTKTVGALFWLHQGWPDRPQEQRPQVEARNPISAPRLACGRQAPWFAVVAPGLDNRALKELRQLGGANNRIWFLVGWLFWGSTSLCRPCFHGYQPAFCFVSGGLEPKILKRWRKWP